MLKLKNLGGSECGIRHFETDSDGRPSTEPTLTLAAGHHEAILLSGFHVEHDSRSVRQIREKHPNISDRFCLGTMSSSIS